MSFADHFSKDPAGYAEFRPRYPASLFDFLASQSPGRRTAWDCATGNGQAALELASRFERVIATDASAAQIGSAFRHPRIEYRVAPAEASGLEAGSIELLTVAQALHWFDRDAFWKEAKRVLVPEGVIAFWFYGLARIAPALDAAIGRFYSDTVGPYWPPERRLLERGSRAIELPFASISAPRFAIESSLTLDGLAGYLRTWSATRRYVEHHGTDPVAGLVAELRPLWGPPEAPRRARWPIDLRLGRHAPGATILLVMGVTGSGKTTIGRRLAADLGWPFLDGDDLHPPANVDKMKRNVPLDDSDRAPWLTSLRERIEASLRRGESLVLACSALKESYRKRLCVDERVKVVYLRGDEALLRKRLESRRGHFAGAGLLPSQLADLEEPRDALTVDVGRTPEEIVATIRGSLRL
ncbi:MAG: gluconokinase, GntK/IdnK-type [Candidatus Binatia bacterium]